MRSQGQGRSPSSRDSLEFGDLLLMNTQFLTDSEGGKVAVVIPIQEYHSLMEDVADPARAAERRDDEQEPTAPHHQSDQAGGSEV